MKTAEARAGIPHEKLAWHLVASFDESRKLGWAVAPLGLIMALTENGED